MWRDVFDRNAYGTNCWLLAADGSDVAVVVDPGFEPDRIRSLLGGCGKRAVAVLLTHAHLDHAEAAGEFAGDDVPVYVHEADAVAFTDPARWNPGFANPLTQVKDLRTIAGGTCWSSRASASRCSTRPGTRPAIAASARTRSSSRATWCSPDRSGAPTSRTRPRRTWRRACAGSSSCPTSCSVLAGPRSRDHGGTRACDEPVPARAHLMELAPPRGTQDLLPDRADAMYGLYEAAHRIAELFGFRYVETPMFEHTELFARTSGETSDVVTKEMYTFEDKGGRSLTLRPESTASVVRAYLDARAGTAEPVQGVLRRIGVPARTAAGGPAPRVPAVRHRGDRGRRCGRRRRGHRAGRAIPPRAWSPTLRPPPELDRR